VVSSYKIRNKTSQVNLGITVDNEVLKNLIIEKKQYINELEYTLLCVKSSLFFKMWQKYCLLKKHTLNLFYDKNKQSSK